jgi:class 3 adenylate cyclase
LGDCGGALKSSASSEPVTDSFCQMNHDEASLAELITQSADAERSPLSILFADLADSTQMSFRMDAEDLREIMNNYQQGCARAAQRYGGYVARYMGDGVMCYFGYPHAHEDDAEWAIRAALGDTPNLAARMQALAVQNAVVVDPSTYRLARAAFVMRELGPQEIKGSARR